MLPRVDNQRTESEKVMSSQGSVKLRGIKSNSMQNKEKELRILNINTDTALAFVDAMRTIDDTLDTTSFSIFFLVCSNEGISNDDIIKHFKAMHKARVSRGIHVLCKTARCRQDQDGDGLLMQKINPKDFRKRSLFLTNRGKSVRDKLSKLLG